MPFTAPHWISAAPLQALSFDWSVRAGVELAVLRLDLLDPLLSGNKWFKLRPHIEAAAAALPTWRAVCPRHWRKTATRWR